VAGVQSGHGPSFHVEGILPTTEAIRARIEDSIEKMPSLPTTVAKVLQIANDLNSSARDLLTVIQMDPVLTAKVLKLINSAFFALPNKVSLKQAIVLLGINTLKNIALSSAIIGYMGKSKVQVRAFDQHKFWEHSLGTAIAAKRISRRVVTDPQQWEEYFVAGLVHDIGKVVIALSLPTMLAKSIMVAEEKKITSSMAEREVIGLDHSEVGAMLARKWRLSESLINATLHHHGPTEADDRLAWVVHTANYYVLSAGYANSGDCAEPMLDPKAYQVLSLAPESFAEIMGNLGEEIGKASTFLTS